MWYFLFFLSTPACIIPFALLLYAMATTASISDDERKIIKPLWRRTIIMSTILLGVYILVNLPGMLMGELDTPDNALPFLVLFVLVSFYMGRQLHNLLLIKAMKDTKDSPA